MLIRKNALNFKFGKYDGLAVIGVGDKELIRFAYNGGVGVFSGGGFQVKHFFEMLTVVV